MRIRGTKPEFWRSRRVASVSWDARLVLKGLESYVDDNGVGKDDIAMIVGDIFARDMFASPRETVARVSEAISELRKAGLLWRYDRDGTDLLYISFWESIQRIDKPGKGRFRRPDGTSEYGESQIRESVARARESVAPGTGEQGNRGTGEQVETPRASAPRTEPPPRFDEFWETYSKKVGRAKAEAAYRQALRKTDVTPDLLIATAAAYITFQLAEGKHPGFTKDATTWLRGEHWRDERKSVQAPMTNTQRHMALVQELAEREQGPRPPHPLEIGQRP